MGEKCFCHFNGYEVKDAYARSYIETEAKPHIANKENPHGVTAAQTGAVEMKILWKNARATGFVAQTLTFAENDYTHFGVVLGDLFGNCHPMIILKVGDKGLATQLGGDTGTQSGGGLIMNRKITESTQNSMTFSDCKYVSVGNGSDWTELNSQLMPLFIYGIKGVKE